MTTRKLIRRFYEPIHLLHALDPVQGGRKKTDRVSDAADLSQEDLLREFLNAVAYICDTDKGGKTVSAAAIQETPSQFILWIASNADVREATQCRLREIFSMLQPQEPDKTAIMKTMVQLAHGRLKQYRKWAKDGLENILGNPALLKQLGGLHQKSLSHGGLLSAL